MNVGVKLLLWAIPCVLIGWFGRAWFSEEGDSQWQFVEAAERGDTKELERLLQRGAAIDAIPTKENGAISGFPALFVAAGAGQANTVRWLLEHGANPNQESGTTRPLGAAESRASEATETVNILKAHGAKRP